jgi:hypothetical protein
MTISREQILETLQSGWGNYAARFHQLSPLTQAAELNRQGYARFADILAHVIAWWRDGLQAIPSILADPAYRSPDIDVDPFNARAVIAFRDMAEPAVQKIFDDTHRQWIDLVNALPDQAFRDERIAKRLEIEVIGHLQEHELMEGPTQ